MHIAFQQSEEKKEQLRNALKNLTKKQIEIIRLKFFDNLSYAEIAAKTSLTSRTVYNLIYEAIRKKNIDRMVDGRYKKNLPVAILQLLK